ncbi:MAG: GNAT family N-acetyltransferase [Betaproteobacteria bacterium]|nr:GNAT family N-acetyltransferase [Betaproteobacteria bacterium]
MEFRVSLAHWADIAERVRPLRLAVFVVEQGVPAHLEMDDRDRHCLHALAEDASGAVIGTGRLLPQDAGVGRVGRMAVAPDWRGKGVGAAMLDALLAAARARGDLLIELHAQLHAAPFYDRAGFARVGDVYEEAGIPHITMRRALTA